MTDRADREGHRHAEATYATDALALAVTPRKVERNRMSTAPSSANREWTPGKAGRGRRLPVRALDICRTGHQRWTGVAQRKMLRGARR